MVLPFLLFASPAILISVLIVTGTLTICTLFCPFTHPVKYPVNTKTLYCQPALDLKFSPSPRMLRGPLHPRTLPTIQ